jgi:hypothetical protein
LGCAATQPYLFGIRVISVICGCAVGGAGAGVLRWGEATDEPARGDRSSSDFAQTSARPTENKSVFIRGYKSIPELQLFADLGHAFFPFANKKRREVNFHSALNFNFVGDEVTSLKLSLF